MSYQSVFRPGLFAGPAQGAKRAGPGRREGPECLRRPCERRRGIAEVGDHRAGARGEGVELDHGRLELAEEPGQALEALLEIGATNNSTVIFPIPIEFLETLGIHKPKVE